jgi:hypothetical protein
MFTSLIPPESAATAVPNTTCTIRSFEATDGAAAECLRRVAGASGGEPWIVVLGDSSMRMFASRLVEMLAGDLHFPLSGWWAQTNATAWPDWRFHYKGAEADLLDLSVGGVRLTYVTRLYSSEDFAQLERLLDAAVPRAPTAILLGTGKWDRRYNVARRPMAAHVATTEAWVANHTLSVERLHALVPASPILFHSTVECGVSLISRLNERLEKRLAECCAGYAAVLRRHPAPPKRIAGCGKGAPEPRVVARIGGYECCPQSACRSKPSECRLRRGQPGAPTCFVTTTCTPLSGHSWGPATTFEVNSALSALCQPAPTHPAHTLRQLSLNSQSLQTLSVSRKVYSDSPK